MCYPYWQNGSVVKFGEFMVEGVTECNKNGYIERELCVSLERQSLVWNIVQFQVIGWMNDGVLRDPRTVLQVIDDVIHRQQKIGGGPIVVHCR